MGMNIYTITGRKHIGKRWAAGVWCWDCKIRAEHDHLGLFWFCTKCGQRCSDKTLSFNPAMRELGFDKSKPRKHTGIDGASGFIWQVGESGIGRSIEEVKNNVSKRKGLKTEYGEKWSIDEFWKMFDDVIDESESDYDFS